MCGVKVAVIDRYPGMAQLSVGRSASSRMSAQPMGCHFKSRRPDMGGCERRHLFIRREPTDRIKVVALCEKSAAVASLQAQKAELTDHLETVARKVKKSPGQFSATESQDLQDIEEITQENYYEKIAEADAPVVLIDFYTQWCGPCKLMYPQLVAMKGELEGQVTFYKFNCNKANKELGTKLEIKVAPTFIFYKGGEESMRLTGAKIEPLQAAIAELTA
eukprot:jgi/Ulvmu1/11560/UM079_0003.1